MLWLLKLCGGQSAADERGSSLACWCMASFAWRVSGAAVPYNCAPAAQHPLLHGLPSAAGHPRKLERAEEYAEKAIASGGLQLGGRGGGCWTYAGPAGASSALQK